MLSSFRTGQHGAFERIVVEFTGGYGATQVRYVPVVHADPSDKIVALHGSAFLEVTVHDAVARWRGTTISPYNGPFTATPNYRTVKQVSISGDFEAVLSFGVGLARTAGFRIFRLASPDRLVIDVAEPPAWRMWPDNGPSQAHISQVAYDQGHQPWRANPLAVCRLYAHAVYGWSNPAVAQVPGTTTYRLSQHGSSDHVVVRTARPFATTSRHSIVEVTDTR